MIGERHGGIFQNDGNVFYLALDDSCMGLGSHLPKFKEQ